jgi:UDP-N-acetylglucosamine 2-epimerase (non-hydrolysing)
MDLTTYKRPLIVFGTRPEAIKMAPLVKEFAKHEGVKSMTLAVSQHTHMLKQVLDVFDVPVDFNLNIMAPNQTLFSITERALHGFAEVLAEAKPDIVLVQGDTSSAFAGALAAFYSKIAVGHVEAGLRTYDMQNPYPEEANRRLIGTLADRHFPPTKASAANLKRERVSPDKIFITGNTVIDALLLAAEREFDVDGIGDEALRNQIRRIDPSKRLVLITAHRRENFGEPIQRICAAIKRLAEAERDVEFVYPVHMNPNIREPVTKALSGIPNVHLVEPLEYDAFIYLMKRATLLLTDSGGVQEEAPSLGKPVLVLREVTERPEAVSAGTVKLVGTDIEKIVGGVEALLHSKSEYARMARAVNPYGDGKASERIVGRLLGIPVGEFRSRF